MRLQPGNRLVGVFTSTSNRGQGHGFISTIDITAVDFFYSGPDLEGGRYAIIGEFAGLTANQVGLGPVPAYGGTVIADFAILRP